jgi:hypothetical protein
MRKVPMGLSSLSIMAEIEAFVGNVQKACISRALEAVVRSERKEYDASVGQNL